MIMNRFSSLTQVCDVLIIKTNNLECSILLFCTHNVLVSEQSIPREGGGAFMLLSSFSLTFFPSASSSVCERLSTHGMENTLSIVWDSLDGPFQQISLKVYRKGDKVRSLVR